MGSIRWGTLGGGHVGDIRWGTLGGGHVGDIRWGTLRGDITWGHFTANDNKGDDGVREIRINNRQDIIVNTLVAVDSKYTTLQGSTAVLTSHHL